MRAERVRAAQGDAGLDGVAVVAQMDSQAVARFVFDVLGGQGFVLDDEGGSARLGDEDIEATMTAISRA